MVSVKPKTIGDLIKLYFESTGIDRDTVERVEPGRYATGLWIFLKDGSVYFWEYKAEG